MQRPGDRDYSTLQKAALAWIRRARKTGYVTILGGGWRQLTLPPTPSLPQRPSGHKVQGLGTFARNLQRRGILKQVERWHATGDGGGHWVKRFEVTTWTLYTSDLCNHEWQEQPGEPPVDICSSCGEVRR